MFRSHRIHPWPGPQSLPGRSFDHAPVIHPHDETRFVLLPATASISRPEATPPAAPRNRPASRSGRKSIVLATARPATRLAAPAPGGCPIAATSPHGVAGWRATAASWYPDGAGRGPVSAPETSCHFLLETGQAGPVIRPVESGPRVSLAARGNMFVAGDADILDRRVMGLQ